MMKAPRRKGLGAVVMAAGLGKRMRSTAAKVLHQIAGRPMLVYVLDLAEQFSGEGVVVVVGHQADKVKTVIEEYGAATGQPVPRLGSARREQGLTASTAHSTAPSMLIAEQPQQLGTGHAVMQARDAWRRARGKAADRYLILNGDTPLLTETTVRTLVDLHEAEKATVTILTTILKDPTGYGRVVRAGQGRVSARPGHGERPHPGVAGDQAGATGKGTSWRAQGRAGATAGESGQGRTTEPHRRSAVVKIIEERDAAPEEVSLREVNVGTYVVEGSFLFEALETLAPQNAQREYYLTDLVKEAVKRGLRVSALTVLDTEETLGINSRRQLADAERVMRRRICERWMEEGVTIRDPATTYIDAEVHIGQDTIVFPHVALEGRTTIGTECEIRSHTRISDSVLGDRVIVQDCCVIHESHLEAETTIGPFAHLRPGTVLRRSAKVGNFVEMKKAELGEGTKANHLSYLGDARIGKGVNIGAGTITCNYDGVQKFETIIEDDVFVGSDTQFIAPVKVGRGAIVAAGSSITQNVPPNALAIARAVQVNRDGWAARRRALVARSGLKARETSRQGQPRTSHPDPRAPVKNLRKRG